MIDQQIEKMANSEEYKERYGFSDQTIEYESFDKGLNEEIVRKISAMKGEPKWMLEKRLSAYKIFLSKPTPNWGADLSSIDYDDIYYYRQKFFLRFPRLNPCQNFHIL